MTNKTPESRDDVINKRLQFMCDKATELKAEGWDRHKEASDNKYIRINGDSMRIVSLEDKSALNGIGGKFYDVKKSKAESDKNLKDLSTEEANGRKSAFEIKKERRLQAHIIKKSLADGGSLLGKKLLICLKDIGFEELLFVTDEISFGDKNYQPIVRCDLFAVGIQRENVFPVLIELKSTRSLGRLFQQLDNASFDLGDPRIPAQEDRSKLISDFIESVTRKIITSYDVKKILIWPSGTSSKDTMKKMKANEKIIYIEYNPVEFNCPDQIEFKRIYP